MSETELSRRYAAYLTCLNERRWDALGEHVADAVRRNGETLGLAGYRAMLEEDVAAIPELHFRADFVICAPPRVGARLLFDCTPVGALFGVPVNGRRVTFTKNVFYRYADGRIDEVWSVIDEAAVRVRVG